MARNSDNRLAIDFLGQQGLLAEVDEGVGRPVILVADWTITVRAMSRRSGNFLWYIEYQGDAPQHQFLFLQTPSFRQDEKTIVLQVADQTTTQYGRLDVKIIDRDTNNDEIGRFRFYYRLVPKALQ